VYLRVREPVPHAAAPHLAAAIVDACTAIAEREAPPVAVAILCGGKAFCLPPAVAAADCDAVGGGWAEATRAVASVEAPTLAVIGGDGVGPAWELALACDLRLAAAHVRVGSPDVRCGRIPAAGGTQRLARLVGPATALRLLLLGEVLAAPAALDLGLVHRVVPAAELAAACDALLGELGAGGPLALAYVKEAVHRAGDLSLPDGLRLEADLAALLQTTHDRAEGLAAFHERRAPRFEAR